jgi:hypothetical protein
MSSTRPLPLEAVLIRSLQLIQTFGLPTVLPWAPVRNWSSLFLRCSLRFSKVERSEIHRRVGVGVSLGCKAQRQRSHVRSKHLNTHSFLRHSVSASKMQALPSAFAS